jgi:hypothetical protein
MQNDAVSKYPGSCNLIRWSKGHLEATTLTEKNKGETDDGCNVRGRAESRKRSQKVRKSQDLSTWSTLV